MERKKEKYDLAVGSIFALLNQINSDYLINDERLFQYLTFILEITEDDYYDKVKKITTKFMYDYFINKKNNYELSNGREMFDSVWEQTVDDKKYNLFIKNDNLDEIIIGYYNDDSIIVEANQPLLKKTINSMTKNIAIITE